MLFFAFQCANSRCSHTHLWLSLAPPSCLPSKSSQGSTDFCKFSWLASRQVHFQLISIDLSPTVFPCFSWTHLSPNGWASTIRWHGAISWPVRWRASFSYPPSPDGRKVQRAPSADKEKQNTFPAQEPSEARIWRKRTLKYWQLKYIKCKKSFVRSISFVSLNLEICKIRRAKTESYSCHILSYLVNLVIRFGHQSSRRLGRLDGHLPSTSQEAIQILRPGSGRSGKNWHLMWLNQCPTISTNNSISVECIYKQLTCFPLNINMDSMESFLL